MKGYEWRHKALILAFCGFIGVFAALYWLLPRNDFSEKEKRVLSALPKLTAASVLDGSAESALEDWMSDHVPGRDTLVGLNAGYEVVSGRNGLNGVIWDGGPTGSRPGDVGRGGCAGQVQVHQCACAKAGQAGNAAADPGERLYAPVGPAASSCGLS